MIRIVQTMKKHGRILMFNQYVSGKGKYTKVTCTSGLQCHFIAHWYRPFHEILCCQIACFGRPQSCTSALSDIVCEAETFASNSVYCIFVAFISVEINFPWVIIAVVASMECAWFAIEIQFFDVIALYPY